jgi:hypothetical protein
VEGRTLQHLIPLTNLAPKYCNENHHRVYCSGFGGRCMVYGRDRPWATFGRDSSNGDPEPSLARIIHEPETS